LTRKWLTIGERVSSRTDGSQQQAQPQSVWAYFRAAMKASPGGQAVAALLQETRDAVAANAGVTSPQVTGLIKRLEEMCREYDLGDPGLYARWMFHMGTVSDAGQRVESQLEDRAAWKLLTEAWETGRSPSGT
jgi:hypothetical protein